MRPKASSTGFNSHMKELIQIIYISSSKVLLDEDQLCEFSSSFSRNNEEHGITGLLLYKDGSFMQVIEGEKLDIEQLYFNIEKDARHSGVVQLIKESIAQRQFPEWSMAVRHIPPDKNPEFSDFFVSNSDSATLGYMAETLLKSFKNL